MINQATAELIADLIDKIERDYEVTSVVDNGDGTYTLAVECSTLWMRPCQTIEIDTRKYQITDLDPDKTLTIKPVKHSTPPTTGVKQANKPVYFYGTIRMVNAQLAAIGNSVEFTPLIYFVEVFTEDYDETPDSAIEYETDVNILFMDDNNYEDWAKAEQHYTGAINPMRNLLEAFLHQVRRSGRIAQLAGFRVTPHSNFGVFQNNQGHVRRLLEADLSGCELRITLPICESLTCENQC